MRRERAQSENNYVKTCEYRIIYHANIAGNGRERERENENDRGRRKEADNKGFARAEEEEMQNVG